MIEVLLRLILLAGLTLPAWALLVCIWRWAWPSARRSERWLAAAVSLALLALAEVGALGYLPASAVARPLDHLLWLHLAVLGVLALSAARCRRAMRGQEPPSWSDDEDEPRIAALAWIATLGLVFHAAVGGYAAWNVHWLADALHYHVPQVLQPWQDGRLGHVWAEAVWADSYPRAASLLKFWSMRLSGTDAAINIVSWWWGWVFVLAVYVSGRRLGLSRQWSLAAAGMAPTAPIFALLGTIGYADLDMAACVAAGVAFAVPRREEAWDRGAMSACLAALMLALWMKFGSSMAVAAVVAVRSAGLLKFRAAAGVRGDAPARLGMFAASGVVMLAAAAGPYVQTWMRYGSPVWPIRLELFGMCLFDGPHTIASLTPGHGDYLQRFSQQWTSWFNELTPDSFGNLGPLFGVLMVGPMLAGVVAAAVARKTGWLTLASLVVVVLAGPQLHAARYALYVLVPGCLFAAWAGGMIRDRAWTTGLGALAFALQAGNCALLVRGVVQDQQTLAANAADAGEHSLMTARRNGVWIDAQTVRGDPRWPTAETRRVVRAMVPKGGLLISAVHGPTTLLHNAEFSYRVEHLPAAPWPLDFDVTQRPGYGLSNTPAWMRVALLADAVLAYRGSAEDWAMQQRRDWFELAFEQDARSGPAVIRLYRVIGPRTPES